MKVMKTPGKDPVAQALVHKRWEKPRAHQAAAAQVRAYWRSKTAEERAERMRRVRSGKSVKE
jgi:hypothetical protein